MSNLEQICRAVGALSFFILLCADAVFFEFAICKSIYRTLKSIAYTARYGIESFFNHLERSWEEKIAKPTKNWHKPSFRVIRIPALFPLEISIASNKLSVRKSEGTEFGPTSTLFFAGLLACTMLFGTYDRVTLKCPEVHLPAVISFCLLTLGSLYKLNYYSNHYYNGNKSIAYAVASWLLATLTLTALGLFLFGFSGAVLLVFSIYTMAYIVFVLMATFKVSLQKQSLTSM